MKNHVLLAGAALLALAPAGYADQKADALLRQVAAKTKATKTLSADLQMTMRPPTGQGQTVKSAGSVRLMKPNYARITLTGGPLAQTIASDGKSLYLLNPGNQYQKRDADPQGRNISALWALPIAYFFNPTLDSFAPFGRDPDTKVRYAGRQTVGGAAMDLVALTGDKPMPHTITLFIGPDKLFHRVRVDLKQGSETARYEAAFTNLRAGKPLTAASFAYTPPKTAKLHEPPDLNAKLVPVGSKAPAFDLPTPAGGKLALENTLKDKKAVLVNFWFYN